MLSPPCVDDSTAPPPRTADFSLRMDETTLPTKIFLEQKNQQHKFQEMKESLHARKFD
jgi:hypothetical protein